MLRSSVVAFDSVMYASMLIIEQSAIPEIFKQDPQTDLSINFSMGPFTWRDLKLNQRLCLKHRVKMNLTGFACSHAGLRVSSRFIRTVAPKRHRGAKVLRVILILLVVQISCFCQSFLVWWWGWDEFYINKKLKIFKPFLIQQMDNWFNNLNV